jgi:hypothetical protein
LKRTEWDTEHSSSLNEGSSEIKQKVEREQRERLDNYEGIVQITQEYFLDTRNRLENERKERLQSEEVMLQLLEQTCNQIALWRSHAADR